MLSVRWLLLAVTTHNPSTWYGVCSRPHPLHWFHGSSPASSLTLFALAPPRPGCPQALRRTQGRDRGKLEAKGVKGYTLDAVEADKVPADATVVGSLRGGQRQAGLQARLMRP